MALFGVLQTALSAQNNIAYPSSEVIMVTMAGVSDANNRIPSTQEVSSSRAKLHYVYINGTCGQAPSNDSMNYLARLAYGSSGNVLVVIPENVGSVSFEAGLCSKTYFLSCSPPTSRHFTGLLR